MNRGFSLIATMVAVAISGLVALAFAAMFKNHLRATNKVRQDMDLETIRGVIFKKVDCQQTLKGYCAGGSCGGAVVPTCPGGNNLIALKDRAGTTFLSSSGTPAFGNWTLRAQCSSTGIDIRAARLKPLASITSTDPNDFYLDPMNSNVVLDFYPSPPHTSPNSNQKAMLFNPMACSDFFAGSANPAVTVTPTCWYSYVSQSVNGAYDYDTTCRISSSPDQICQAAGFKSWTGRAKGSVNGYTYDTSMCIVDSSAGVASCPAGTYMACIGGGAGVLSDVDRRATFSITCPNQILCQ